MIDNQRLREMEADFGADELDGIVAAFLEEAAAAVAALRAGWADEAIRRDRLHFLKGCAWTIGAVRLGDSCERVEGEANPGRADLRELEREFRAAREALARHRLRQVG